MNPQLINHKRMRPTWSLTLGASALLLAGAALAQDMTPIEQPTLKIGDSWTYRILDGWNNKEIRQSVSTLVAFENNLSVFRFKNLTSGVESTGTLNADLQPCRSMQNDSTLICAGSFKFPLTTGFKHSFKKLPSGSGQSYFDGDCEGKGMEKVQVPAGEFDAYRIECKGFWTRVFGNSGSGSFQETRWYAPAIRNQVKSIYEDRRSNGSADNKSITELVEYKPAP